MFSPYFEEVGKHIGQSISMFKSMFKVFQNFPSKKTVLSSTIHHTLNLPVLIYNPYLLENYLRATFVFIERIKFLI